MGAIRRAIPLIGTASTKVYLLASHLSIMDISYVNKV